jgi:hypothetical protein
LAYRPPALIDRGSHVLKESQPPCRSSASTNRPAGESTPRASRSPAAGVAIRRTRSRGGPPRTAR